MTESQAPHIEPALEDEEPPDPFSTQLFGTNGWTRPLVEMMEPCLLPDAGHNWNEFYGVPHQTILAVAHAVKKIEAEGAFTLDDFFWEEPIAIGSLWCQP
jgi:hypothetical protein